MTHNIKLFTYDVIRLGISKERRSFYGSCDYEFGPLYRNFNQMKTAALEIGQQLNPNGREVLWIPHLTEDQLMANGCEAAYNLSIRNEEEKTDIILVLRALFADRDVQKHFYSYNLSRLSIPPMPTKTRIYDVTTFYHAPLFNDFDTFKASLVTALGCAGDLGMREYPALRAAARELNRDVTNIGRWQKEFSEDRTEYNYGLVEWKLSVYRTGIEG